MDCPLGFAYSLDVRLLLTNQLQLTPSLHDHEFIILVKSPGFIQSVLAEDFAR